MSFALYSQKPGETVTFSVPKVVQLLYVTSSVNDWNVGSDGTVPLVTALVHVIVIGHTLKFFQLAYAYAFRYGSAASFECRIFYGEGRRRADAEHAHRDGEANCNRDLPHGFRVHPFRLKQLEVWSTQLFSLTYGQAHRTPPRRTGPRRA